MVTEREEQEKHLEQAAWLTLLAVGLLMLLVIVALVDQLFFEGQLFGER